MDGLIYNTAREEVAIPAYGRYVQQMLERAVELEGERQQALVARIVQMMMTQQAGDESLAREDMERKMWMHAYRLSDYRLTAVPPDGNIPTPDEDRIPPEEVPYPKSAAKQRNYGHYVQKMIEKALETSDAERRKAITQSIGSYMKLAYSTYNDAQNISDKTILSDLRKLSDGKLELSEEVDLDAFMGRGSQSHIKQTAPTSRRRRSKGKSGNRNRKRYRKR